MKYVEKGGCVDRVTRLGEFWNIGRLFIFGSFCKTAEGSQIVGQLFSTVHVLTKNGLGKI
jgi:hypothetical protein